MTARNADACRVETCSWEEVEHRMIPEQASLRREVERLRAGIAEIHTLAHKLAISKGIARTPGEDALLDVRDALALLRDSRPHPAPEEAR